jgi:molybdate transport system regulatory protein
MKEHVMKDHAIALDGAVWLTVGGEKFGGADRVALLRAIAQSGSITQAAKSLKISYKAAWDAIDAMNNLAGVALVARTTGGKGGGGTRLTPRGAQLVDNFALIAREHRRFVAQLGAQAESIADDVLLIRRMGLKTTARNQFTGHVTLVKRGSVNDEIELCVAGGHKIVAIVTHESTDGLGLVPGAQAFALINGASIIVVTEGFGARFSARNQLAGHIARLQTGAVNTEVVIALPGGGTIAAIVTNDSSAQLGLAVGQAASAIFKASCVILGVPA